MSLRIRRAIDQSLLPIRSNRASGLFRVLHWTLVVLALTIHGVGGTTYDDDCYYQYNSSNDYEYDAEEEERVHEMLVDDWYDLIRYLVGLGVCIFGLIGLYFHQFASYYFLKKYARPRETERRIGRVLSCEPILSSTSITVKKNKSKEKKEKNKKNKYHGVPVPTFRGDVGGDGSSATDYVRDEDWEHLGYVQQQQQPDQEFTDYRMLVVYKVPRPRSSSLLLCCGPIGPLPERKLVIDCSSSFGVASCNSRISDIDSMAEAIDTYRSRSLPHMGNDNYDFNGKLTSCNMDYMNRNDECEYFQWFETSKPKPIDSDIDLILLKGKPTSACTPEVLELHLEQVGKAHDREEHMLCKSISLMGIGLVLTVIVLLLVCVFEIQAMPNPEDNRPIAYTVVGGFFVGSTVSAYLFGNLLFEQYKQTVFLSAFIVPFNIDRRRMSSTTSDCTGIIADDMIEGQQQERQASDELAAATVA
jgi:multisubunit Na+/H+ antiporter MnhB subunit